MGNDVELSIGLLQADKALLETEVKALIARLETNTITLRIDMAQMERVNTEMVRFSEQINATFSTIGSPINAERAQIDINHVRSGLAELMAQYDKKPMDIIVNAKGFEKMQQDIAKYQIAVTDAERSRRQLEERIGQRTPTRAQRQALENQDALELKLEERRSRLLRNHTIQQEKMNAQQMDALHKQAKLENNIFDKRNNENEKNIKKNKEIQSLVPQVVNEEIQSSKPQSTWSKSKTSGVMGTEDVTAAVQSLKGLDNALVSVNETMVRTSPDGKHKEIWHEYTASIDNAKGGFTNFVGRVRDSDGSIKQLSEGLGSATKAAKSFEAATSSKMGTKLDLTSVGMTSSVLNSTESGKAISDLMNKQQGLGDAIWKQTNLWTKNNQEFAKYTYEIKNADGTVTQFAKTANLTNGELFEQTNKIKLATSGALDYGKALKEAYPDTTTVGKGKNLNIATQTALTDKYKLSLEELSNTTMKLDGSTTKFGGTMQTGTLYAAQNTESVKEIKFAYDEVSGAIHTADKGLKSYGDTSKNAIANTEAIKKANEKQIESENKKAEAIKKANEATAFAFKTKVGTKIEGFQLPNIDTGLKGIESAIKTIEGLSNATVKANGVFKYGGETFNGYTASVKNSAGGWERFEIAQNTATGSVYKTEKALDSTNKALVKQGDNIMGLMAKVFLWTAATSLIFAPLKLTKDAISEMKKVDTELINIRKVTEMTKEETKAFGLESYATAQRLGVVASTLTKATADWAKMGYAMQSIPLAEMQMKLSQVGDVSDEIANKFLQVADKSYGFHGSVQALSGVMDSANEIGNKYATSVEKIAQGFGLVGSLAAQSEVSINEVMASIGTITAITGESGDVAARAMRAIILNLRQVKGEIYDDETGEIIDDAQIARTEKALNQAGVKIREFKDGIENLRPPMEIIADLQNKVNSGLMSEVELQTVLDVIGGKTRSNQLSALIKNQSEYLAQLDTAENAIGSVDKEWSKVIEGWDFKTKQLSATWTEFVAKSLDTDWIKGLLDLSRSLIKSFDNLGTTLLLVTGLILFFNTANAAKGIISFGAAVGSTANSMLALAKGTTAAMAGTAALSVEAVKLQGAFGWIGVAAIAVSILAMAFSAAERSEKEATQAALELSKANQTQIDKYSKLISQIKDETMTREDMVAAITDVNKAYGEEVNSINDINEARKRSIKILQDEKNEKASNTILTTSTQYTKASEFMSNKRGTDYSFQGQGLSNYQKSELPTEELARYRQEIESLIQKQQESSGLNGYETKELKKLENSYTDLSKKIKEAEEIIAAYNNAEAVINTKDLNFTTQEEFNEYIQGLKDSKEYSQELKDAMLTLVSDAFKPYSEELKKMQTEEEKLKGSQFAETLLKITGELKDVDAFEFFIERIKAATDNTNYLTGAIEYLTSRYPLLATEANNSAASFKSIDTTELADGLSLIEGKITLLNEASNEYITTGYMTAAVFKSLTDNNLLQYLEGTADGLEFNTAALNNEFEALKANAQATVIAAGEKELLALAEIYLSDEAKNALTPLSNLQTNIENAGITARNSASLLNAFTGEVVKAKLASGGIFNTVNKSNYLNAIEEVNKKVKDSFSKIDKIKIVPYVAPKSSSGSSSSSSGGAKSKTEEDVNKKAFEEQLKELKRQKDARLIDEKEYVDLVEVLYKKHFSNLKKYQNEFSQYEKDVFDDRVKIFNDSMSDMEHNAKMLANIDTQASIDQQVDIFKDLKEKTHLQAQYYRSLNIKEDDALIQDLQSKWWGYHDNINSTNKKMYDDRRAHSEEWIETQKFHNQLSYKEEKLAYDRIEKYTLEFHKKGILSLKEYNEISVELTKKRTEREIKYQKQLKDDLIDWIEKFKKESEKQFEPLQLKIEINSREIEALDYQLSEIQDDLNDKIEPIELSIKIKDSEIKIIDEQIKGINTQLQNNIVPLQEQLKEYDKQIEALERAKKIEESRNKIEEARLALLKAEENLKNAQNERTVSTLVGEKWEWRADVKAVEAALKEQKDAEKNLADLVYEAKIEELQLLKQNIEDKIEIFQEEAQVKIDQLETQKTLLEEEKQHLQEQLEYFQKDAEQKSKALEEQKKHLERVKKQMEYELKLMQEKNDDINKKWDIIVEGLQEPTKTIGEILKDISENGVPALKTIVEQVNSILGSIEAPTVTTSPIFGGGGSDGGDDSGGGISSGVGSAIGGIIGGIVGGIGGVVGGIGGLIGGAIGGILSGSKSVSSTDIKKTGTTEQASKAKVSESVIDARITAENIKPKNNKPFNSSNNKVQASEFESQFSNSKINKNISNDYTSFNNINTDSKKITNDNRVIINGFTVGEKDSSEPLSQILKRMPFYK